MTHPPPSLLDAIAEVCKWHGLVMSRHPSRVLRDGGRQEILPPEIPQAIRNGEIPVPEDLLVLIARASGIAKYQEPQKCDWQLGGP